MRVGHKVVRRHGPGVVGKDRRGTPAIVQGRFPMTQPAPKILLLILIRQAAAVWMCARQAALGPRITRAIASRPFCASA